jgi:hypothetical protein
MPRGVLSGIGSLIDDHGHLPGHRPVERHALAMPLSRAPNLESALPRFVLGHRPAERHALAGPFLERGAEGGHGLLKPCGAALALAERPKCVAEIVLGHRPVERHALAGPFLERGAEGGHGLTQGGVVAFLVTMFVPRIAVAREIVTADAGTSSSAVLKCSASR